MVAAGHVRAVGATGGGEAAGPLLSGGTAGGDLSAASRLLPATILISSCSQAQREAEVRERETAARQDGMREKIATNLEHLAQEKVLIHSGQQLLANMTTDVRKQLGESPRRELQQP